ncbi:ABC transporter substrate-binding protein [Thermococcus peptonophilus]|uniref:Iron ABC transporter ATP-binding protein n=1 Tax=Thermococcus peptonophilus TaxID=53952 RepID=A0A142CSR7_9EURY|nr:ABC transporter substrate-binding protein [Thermococcus peptonophilus]AMQ17819.1 iron ABC transporter ATP-binding protein [Thermococcus peptonophilus]
MRKAKLLGALLLVAIVFVSGCIGSSGSSTTQSKAQSTSSPSTTLSQTQTQTETANSCECPTAKPYYPITITDFAGRNVTIEKEPKKIVSLAPSITETLYFLGALNRVVGVTKFDDYPPGVQKGRTIIGGFSDPNIEVIASLEPDLIIGTSMHLKYLDQLEKIAPVIIIDPKNMDEVYKAVELLGKVLNMSGEAEGVVQFMKAEVADVQFRVANRTKPRVLFITWWNPLYVPGNGTFQDSLIGLAGGENVFHDATGWAQVSLEEAVARNPEIIILSAHAGATIDDICNSPLADTDAVKNGRIYFVSDDNAISRPGPRLVEALEELSYFIHPEAYGYNFQPVSCPVEG